MRAAGFIRVGPACVVVAALASGCAALPSQVARTPSSALADTTGTSLGQGIAPMAAAHPGLTGIYPLSDGRDAFAARALLCRRAERSIDLQYYIWRNDLTGLLLLDALRSAAARGVRVRLLLDDNNTAGLDPVLLALDRDPNIEVRLFNPFAQRGWRSIGFLSDFARLNRRMHNKSFTVDNQATIVGGRNVGDEYFGAADDLLFVDLDVVAIGPAVQAVSQDFDRYWNSSSAYPITALVDDDGGQGPDFVAAQAAALRGQPEARAYLDAVRRLPFVEQLARRSLPLEWSEARLVSDDPAKVLGKAAPESRVAVKLRALLGEPRQSVDLVSPYFVPGKETTRTLADMARRGVKVRVLTNSLQATDVAAVHAGYAKWRRELLEGGVVLYELRRLDDGAARQKRVGALGSSASSLHAKTFGVDGRRVFVGSFNFDPRSIDLNTEMGLVIESPVLARQLDARLSESTPERAYEVRLDREGKLFWRQRSGNEVLVYREEPETSFWKRAAVRIMSWLPIDWLL